MSGGRYPRDGDNPRRASVALLAWLLPLGALLVAIVTLSTIGRTLFGPSGEVLAETASPELRSLVAAAPETPIPAESPTAPPTPTPGPTPVPTASPTPTADPTARPAAARTPAPTPTPTPRPPSLAALPARDPAETVARFYDLVEAHEFDAAARLWSPRMRRQYPPRGYIDGRFARTTRIDLRRNRIVSLNRRTGRAVVAVNLVEYRTVEPSPRRFVGSWDLVLVNGRWLMDRPHF